MGYTMRAELTAREGLLEVSVYQPQTWWRATAMQLGELVTDPDTGRGPRWPSYDQNWKLIGDTVNNVADAVAARHYTLDPDDENLVVVWVPDKGPDKLERQIVRAWFGGGESVAADPWDGTWHDGRHRTFHTAKANPDMGLPVLSEDLHGIAGRLCLERELAEAYANSLDELADVPWFDHSDPLNVAYRQSLQRAAFGIPPATDVPAVQAFDLERECIHHDSLT
ncbi:hypothetical protein [Arthrobacter pityocampae]|uniref:hypothetical protein n=1 Tax=Arthrobacter pityocampae TaxID=547334 RepID=UPI003736D52F